YDLAFQEVLDFDDMVKLSPGFRENSKKQKVQINYAPIRNNEDNKIDYIMIIGTDKTTEIENMEKFNRELNFSRMVKKVAGNRFIMNKIIQDSFVMLNQCEDVIKKDEKYPVQTIQRLIHTIKGGFSAFYVSEVFDITHALESYLEKHFNDEILSEEVKQKLEVTLPEIKQVILNYIDKYDDILQYKESQNSKSIEVQDLLSFQQSLVESCPALA